MSFTFGKHLPAPCQKDCPRRSATCHNAETCEIWAAHEARKAQAKHEQDMAYATRRMNWETRKRRYEAE